MPPAAAARRALLAPFAIAATVAVATSGTPVRAIDSCVLPSVESLSFGPYDPLLGAPVDGTGSVTYYCTGAAETITITIDRGASASFWPRHMTSAGGTLDYNLYLDPARVTVWGDGSAGTGHYQETAIVDLSQVLTIFGRIPGGQNARVGSYDDTLVITLSF